MNLNQFVTNNVGWLWLAMALIACGALAWAGFLHTRLARVNSEYKPFKEKQAIARARDLCGQAQSAVQWGN